MSESSQERELERRRRNIEAVARHMSTRAPAESPDGSSLAPGTMGRWGRWGSIGVLVIFVLSKLKMLIPLIKFAKLHTLATMLLAVWAYAQIWGFAFGLGFVLLIFVHECGHLVAMRQQGIRAGAPVFIPFVGAVIAMKSLPRNAYVEAIVGIGGPALGTLGAVFCLLVGFASGSLFWFALASTGFLINLFNMIPITPLDGGRIVGVISRWIWLAGYALGIALFLATWSPILMLILLVGLLGLGRALRGPREGYYEVDSAKRWRIGFAYFGLMAVMVLGMRAADTRLEGFRSAFDSERHGGVPSVQDNRL